MIYSKCEQTVCCLCKPVVVQLNPQLLCTHHLPSIPESTQAAAASQCHHLITFVVNFKMMDYCVTQPYTTQIVWPPSVRCTAYTIR